MAPCKAFSPVYEKPTCNAEALNSIVFAQQQNAAVGGAGCIPGQSGFKNMFGYTKYNGDSYDGSCSFFEGTPPLPEVCVCCTATSNREIKFHGLCSVDAHRLSFRNY
jgi:hypothetical protein